MKEREDLSVAGMKGMKHVTKDINGKKLEDQNSTSRRDVRGERERED